MVDGLPSLKFTKWKFLCPGCVIGKMKTPPVPRKSINRPAALALPNEVKGIVLLCFDMIESSRFVPSWQGNRYTTFFKDRDSEMQFVFHTKHKKEFKNKALKAMIEIAEADNKVIDAFMSDAEHLYWTKDAISIAKTHNKAIKIGSSPAERKDFNGFIESGIGDTIANARALIADAP